MVKKKKNTDIEIPLEMQVHDLERYKEIIKDLTEHVDQVQMFLFEDQCDIGRANLLVSLGELFALSRIAKKVVK